MMYFKAMFTNGENVFFDAKDPDTGIDIGNKKASQKGMTMIAIGMISEKEAIANDYEKTSKTKAVKNPVAKKTPPVKKTKAVKTPPVKKTKAVKKSTVKKTKVVA